MEYDHARSLWMAGIRHMGDMETTEADYETQFSMMVEQEVERRLFQVRKPSYVFFYLHHVFSVSIIFDINLE